VILRSDGAQATFARYAAFLRDHPSWPETRMFRLRAEARLWSEQCEPDVVFGFFSSQEPLSALGKLALARAHLARGKGAAVGNYVRSAWREDNFSPGLESQVLRTFGTLLTRADHRARMQTRLYTNEFATALRAAKRIGPAERAIVLARIAVVRGASNARARLNAVPKAAHQDATYLLTRVQWLRRNGRIGQARQLILSAKRNAKDVVDADAWWVERRILVRELLDDGEAQAAYRIARDAALPSRESLRVDQPFTAGWIALQFLNEPDTAAQHFSRIPQFTTHPTSIARGAYWLGRAAEAAGRASEANRHYKAAAQHSAAYYGQLALARLGRRNIAIRRAPTLTGAEQAALRQTGVARAVELLYATKNRDLVVSFVADLARIADVRVLAMIAKIAARHKDARAMLHTGRGALLRGFKFDDYAFPTVGLPKFTSIGPQADTSLLYAIVRTESAFSTRALSSARAQGLMQLMPATGRIVARRLGLKFSAKRLRADPAYNVQLGSAEIADLVKVYDGNHVLAFVGYNAGRGRVKQWVGRYGDPRDPNVDVVDWVERIPFTETRNYVQRVMENLQVYRSHFGAAPRLNVEADMRGNRG
jgi:soluble lytic murein transglycosylase